MQAVPAALDIHKHILFCKQLQHKCLPVFYHVALSFVNVSDYSTLFGNNVFL